MTSPWYNQMADDPMSMYQNAMLHRAGAVPRRFDEYYRCYPIAMMPGPDRENANHGGKVFMPASALEKLTRMHISYPMLFEVINGAKERQTHAGVLEFTAEEGKIYLPFWLMQTVLLEPGDLVQIKSTDLQPGSFIKLQPQSVSFLDISDPKAVLENAFRNFSCLTQGDIFSFSYNDNVYEIAVLEVRPDSSKHAICTMETDLSVDFAPPIGYEEPKKTSGASTPRSVSSIGGLPTEGTLYPQGTMAQAINYADLAPSSSTSIAGARAASSNFASGGHRLATKRAGGKTITPKPSTPTVGSSTNGITASIQRRANGPQPLRLPPGKLFFGYEIKPVRKRESSEEVMESEKPRFQGQGQTLRKKKVDTSAKALGSPHSDKKLDAKDSGAAGGQKLGRTLRDMPR